MGVIREVLNRWLGAVNCGWSVLFFLCFFFDFLLFFLGGYLCGQHWKISHVD